MPRKTAYKPSPMVIGRKYVSGGFHVGTLEAISGSLLTFRQYPDGPTNTYLNNGSFHLVHSLDDAPVITMGET